MLYMGASNQCIIHKEDTKSHTHTHIHIYSIDLCQAQVKLSHLKLLIPNVKSAFAHFVIIRKISPVFSLLSLNHSEPASLYATSKSKSSDETPH